MLEVTIHAVGTARTEEGVVVLGLGENDHGVGHSFLVTRLVDDDGRALPGESYTLSTETGASTAGGVAGISFDGDVMSLLVGKDASDQLGIDPQVLLALPSDQVENVRLAMSWLLEPSGPAPEHLFQPPLR
jgi:hypothetical protein